jgi:hypothetical protein
MTGTVRQLIGHKDRKQADRGQIFRKTDEQTLGETDRQAGGQADGQAAEMTDGNADG